MKDFVHVPYTPLPMRVDIPTPRFLGVDELPCERRGHHFEVSGKCRDCQHGAYDILTTDERIEHARTVAVQLEQELAELKLRFQELLGELSDELLDRRDALDAVAGSVNYDRVRGKRLAYEHSATMVRDVAVRVAT